MGSLGWIKFRRRLERILQIAGRDSFAPLFDRLSLWALIQVPVNLVLVRVLLGEGAVMDEFTLESLASFAFILTLPVWFLINIFRAPFVMWREERESGQWYSNRFVYHEPRRVFSVIVTPEDGLKKYVINLTDLEANAFVGYTVEHNSYSGLIAWQLFGQLRMAIAESNNLFELEHFATAKKGGVRLDRFSMSLIAQCKENADPVHIRAYISYWEPFSK